MGCLNTAYVLYTYTVYTRRYVSYQYLYIYIIYLSLKCSQSETGSCMQFYKKVLKTVWFRPQVGPQIGDPTSAACGPRTLRALSVPWPGCGEAGGLKEFFWQMDPHFEEVKHYCRSSFVAVDEWLMGLELVNWRLLRSWLRLGLIYKHTTDLWHFQTVTEVLRGTFCRGKWPALSWQCLGGLSTGNRGVETSLGPSCSPGIPPLLRWTSLF
jgi:hypothetical protein